MVNANVNKFNSTLVSKKCTNVAYYFSHLAPRNSVKAIETNI